MKIILAVVFAVALIGCDIANTNVTRENYAKIQNGMTTQQVRAILGAPGSTSETDMGPVWASGEVWTYQLGLKGIMITFTSGKVTSKTMTDL